MASRRIALPAVLFVVVAATGAQLLRSAVAAELPADSPLFKPAFSATADELLQLAESDGMHLDGASAEILLDEGLYSVHPDGRHTLVARQIIRFATREAFDEFGVVQTPWSPWFQERPLIAARVITPNGRIHELDKDTIEEVRVPARQLRVFTDQKLLRVPLPALTEGCIAETQITTHEHRPFSQAGIAGHFQMGTLTAPTRLVHVRVETPEEIPFRHAVLSSHATPTFVVEDGTRIATVLSSSVPALIKDVEPYLPTTVPPIPMITWSTASSWEDIAHEYATIVEQQLADAHLEDIAREALETTKGNSPEDMAESILALIHARTRYTGILFGQSAIVPQKPAQTLTRGYGDCKDLATLLVGVLRAAGLRAHVALIRAGRSCRTSSSKAWRSAGRCRNFTNLPDDPDFWLASALPPWSEQMRSFAVQKHTLPKRMGDMAAEFDVVEAGHVGEMWRVTVTHKTVPQLTWDAFVTATSEGLRIYYAGREHEELGAKALQLISMGRETDARQILQWCFERQRNELSWFDPLQGSPFARLWIAGHEQTADVNLAAAALAATSGVAQDALPLLLAAPAQQESIKQLQIDRAIAHAYGRLEDFEKLQTHLEAVSGGKTNASEFVSARFYVLGQREMVPELESLLNENTASAARPFGLLTLAQASTSTGDLARAAEALCELKKNKDKLPVILRTNITRLSCFQDELPPDTLALATETLQESQTLDLEERTAATVNAYSAYAVALVEEGKLNEAVHALWSIPGLDADRRPNRLDKYVLGRVAEQCGLATHARQFFEQITPSSRPQPNSIYDLAQRRLLRLGTP